MFEHVGSHADLDYVVDHQLTEGGQEVSPFVELFNFHILIHVICQQRANVILVKFMFRFEFYLSLLIYMGIKAVDLCGYAGCRYIWV